MSLHPHDGSAEYAGLPPCYTDDKIKAAISNSLM